MNTTEVFIDDGDMDYDPFVDLHINQTSEQEIYEYHQYDIFISVVDILRLLFCLIGISSYIFLATVIFKFKKLRTRTNMYILNMCFLYIAYTAVGPINYAMSNIFIHFYFPSEVFNLARSAFMLYTIFAVLLALDWFLSGYKPNFIVKYHKIYKYFLLGIYVTFFIEWVCSIFYTYMVHILSGLTFIVIYLVITITLIVLMVLKRKVSLNSECKNTEYALTTAEIAVLPFLPGCVFHVVINIAVPFTAYLFLSHFEVLVEAILYCHPVLVVYVLGQENKYFRTAYDKILKKSVREYQDEAMDDGSENNIV